MYKILLADDEGIVIELYGYKCALIFNQNNHAKEELENNKKEYDSLIISIERREKLLSNNNYVSKAPKNIVETENEMLNKERARLQVLKGKIYTK